MLADEVRLQHMLDAARQAVAFIEERSREDLDTDTMLMLAITRLLEIIGEAARCISEKFKADNPQIPWRQISGLRNRLTHEYFDVDLDVIWEIVSQDLPPLITQLEEI
ncbi:MAG: DUF86 domain-containing protein [Pseudomonadota bacterium]